MRTKINNVISNVIEEYNKENPRIELSNSQETTLMGRGSVLDSLGIVNFLISIEQELEDEFDLTITIADEKAMSKKNSPFKTIASLANYIEELLDKEKNEK